jgi:hypothetical protein
MSADAGAIVGAVLARLGTAIVAFALVTAVSGAGAVAVAAPPPHPFATGFLDDAVFGGPSAALGFRRAAEAGGTMVRVRIDWASVAPAGATMPAGFDPTNPDDPHYDWSSFDAEVAAAVANGQTPIANLFEAPQWAMVSPAPGMPATLPDPALFAEFALAAARRYSGSDGHPRITYWEIWNEPNIGLYAQPQFLNGQAYAAAWYRDLVNRSADAIKSVDPDNFVVAGSTAPYYDATPSTVAVNPTWGPLGFMRAVLCLTPQLTSTSPGCTVRFDAWAHHPYTEGGPTHTASLPDDVELGDLPRMKQVLEAAWAAGHIVASSQPQLWVTEFSWNADPPDPGGVPTALLERWIPEAMYAMWSDGVSVLTWFLLVDSSSPYRSGLYTNTGALAADRPKAIFEAFRFPFVAYRSAGGIYFWGRTPAGRQATVAVEQGSAGAWAPLGSMQSDQYGIFQGRLATDSRLPVRARLTDTGEASVAFSLRTVPDRFFPSFGFAQFEPSRTYGPRPGIPLRWHP